MHKSQKRTAIIVIIIVVVLLVGGYLYFNSISATVSATGQDTLKVQPDEVSVNVQLNVHNQSAQVAKDSLTIISNNVTNALLSLGLNKSEIQTSSYNIYPDYLYENGRRVFKGYVARQSLTVVTSKFTIIPKIVDVSVNAGGTVSGINFQLSSEKQNVYKAKALEKASADARARATATAAGLGKSLGSLISVENQEFRYRPVVYYAQTGAESGVISASSAQQAAINLTPIDINVQGTVVVTYRIGIF